MFGRQIKANDLINYLRLRLPDTYELKIAKIGFQLQSPFKLEFQFRVRIPISLLNPSGECTMGRQKLSKLEVRSWPYSNNFSHRSCCKKSTKNIGFTVEIGLMSHFLIFFFLFGNDYQTFDSLLIANDEIYWTWQSFSVLTPTCMLDFPDIDLSRQRYQVPYTHKSSTDSHPYI